MSAVLVQALSKLTHYADAKVSVQYIPTVTRLVVSGALVAPMQTAATQVAALLLVLRSVPRALFASLVAVCAAEPAPQPAGIAMFVLFCDAFISEC